MVNLWCQHLFYVFLQAFMGSKVSRLQRGSRFHSRPWTAFGIRIYEKNVSFSSSLIQNLEPNGQLFGKMSIFNEDFGSLMPSLSLTLVCDSARPAPLFGSNWPLRRSEAALDVEP